MWTFDPEELALERLYEEQYPKGTLPEEWPDEDEGRLEELDQNRTQTDEDLDRQKEVEEADLFAQQLDLEADRRFRYPKEPTPMTMERRFLSPVIPTREEMPIQSPTREKGVAAPKTSICPPPVVEKNKKGPTPYQTAQMLLARERLIAYGEGLYWFDGRTYRLQNKASLKRLVVHSCRDAVAAAGDGRFIEQVYQCLQSEPSIYKDERKPSPNHVVFNDGILDLNSGQLLAHTPDIFTLGCLNASFKKAITGNCPNFDRLIHQIAQGDEILVQRIWEVLAFLLCPDMRGKSFIVFQGPHDSGKSLLGNFIQGCFDKDSVCSLDLQSFGRNFALSALIARSLCVDLDLPAGPINERSASFVKKLTGGEDAISTDRKYLDPIFFYNTAKLLFATNHAVYTTTEDEAFYRRLVVVPFRESIPMDKQDLYLGEKISTERDAVIVRALLQFFPALRARNFQFTGNFQVNEALGDAEDIYSLLKSFLREYCEEAPDEWIATQEMRAAFFKRFGIELPTNSFSERLKLILPSIYPKVGAKRGRILGRGNPISGLKGLRLKEETDRE